MDRDQLAGAHIGQLGFLVIRSDIDALQRHHRHQLGPGLDVLPDPERSDAHGAADRRRNRRVAEVKLGLVLHRLLLGECRLGLSELSLQNADLLLGSRDTGAVMLECRRLLANVGLRLLRSLHSAVAGLRQVGVALEILLRKDLCRLIRGNELARLLDRQLLLGDLLVEGVDARLRRPDVGAGLVERGLVIAGVDPREHLIGLDRLIVLDRHLGYIARNLGADQHRMRRHIGVIGRDQKAGGRPVVVTINGGRRKNHQSRGRDQQALQ